VQLLLTFPRYLPSVINTSFKMPRMFMGQPLLQEHFRALQYRSP
jgi:hypothetical protein